MGKKFALNIFYNLGLIVSIYGTVWGYNNKNYLPMAFFIATAALFLYLKLQFVKEMRSSFKEKK